MGLKISLRDGDRVIINGAVLRSKGRSEVIVESQARILRGQDVMTPEQADTPARRLYFACMMAYIDEANASVHQESILLLLSALLNAVQQLEAQAACVRVARKVAMLDYYGALTECRWLIEFEEDILSPAMMQ